MQGSLPTGNVPADCHAKIQWLVSYWQSVAPEGQLPGRQHIDPVDFGNLLGNIWLVDVDPASRRFRYRVVGTRVVAYLGQEPTRKWMDEVIPDFESTHTARDLNILVDAAVPRWRRGAPSMRKELYFKTLEQVSLPLARDGSNVDMALNLTLFLDEEGIAI